jgi:hypothetical protein
MILANFNGHLNSSTHSKSSKFHCETEASLPPLTPTLEAIAAFSGWPPDTRRAAIGLYCGEVGLHPAEFWYVAAVYLQAQEVAV